MKRRQARRPASLEKLERRQLLATHHDVISAFESDYHDIASPAPPQVADGGFAANSNVDGLVGLLRNETDFVVTNRGVDLDFKRHYNPQSSLDIGLGPGWTHSYSDVLLFDRDQATWVTSEGWRHTFARTSPSASTRCSPLPFLPACQVETFASPAGFAGELIDLGVGPTTSSEGAATAPTSQKYAIRQNGLEVRFERLLEVAAVGSSVPSATARLTRKADQNGLGVSVFYAKYFQPPAPFDAITSLEIISAVEGNGNQRLEFDHDFYTNYRRETFVRMQSISITNHQYSLLAITPNRMWDLGYSNVADQTASGVPTGPTYLTSVTQRFNGITIGYEYDAGGPLARHMSKVIEPNGDWPTYENGRNAQFVTEETEAATSSAPEHVDKSTDPGNTHEDVADAGEDVPVASTELANQPILPTPQQIQLATTSQADTFVAIHNKSDFKANFTMRLNGKISVNIRDLVRQIRDSDLGGSQTPDYEKAFHYLVKYHAHDFPLTTRTWIHEPSLYLNSVGSGLCDDAASALSSIWTAMGYESRIWLLQGHVVSEVFAAGRWKLYDADLQVYYFNADGEVAGVEDLVAQPDLIFEPRNRMSDNPYVYRRRIAEIYSTLENNRLCTACNREAVARNLVFELPAGATLEWGAIAPFRDLTATHINAPNNVGLLKLTIPPGVEDSVDIALALYDVRGAVGDEILLNDRSLQLRNDDAFKLINKDSRRGERIKKVSVRGNKAPVEIFYLVNEQLFSIEPENLIELEHLSKPAQLVGSVSNELISRRWDFASQGRTFAGSDYIDLSQDAGLRSLFDGQSAFEISTSVSLTSIGSRRPIFDAHRFSLEIDAQNRPYVYYRNDRGGWTALRGETLPEDTWTQVRVNFHGGMLSLHVDVVLVGSVYGGNLMMPIRSPAHTSPRAHTWMASSLTGKSEVSLSCNWMRNVPPNLCFWWCRVGRGRTAIRTERTTT